jgi:hypothetical protein
MNKIALVTSVLVVMLAVHAWPLPAAEPSAHVSFPLALGIVDPDAQEKRPPYIVMFEGGVDKDGQDIRGPLGRLEALRGASKMFPESNQNPGLPVVLRGLRFHCTNTADGTVTGYDVELQGEFNAVRVHSAIDDTKSFLSGQRTTFVLTGEKNYGVYAYVSSIKMDVQLKGREILVFKIEGDFNFREGLSTYTSKTKKLAPPAGRDYLYRGQIAELPDLPSI